MPLSFTQEGRGGGQGRGRGKKAILTTLGNLISATKNSGCPSTGSRIITYSGSGALLSPMLSLSSSVIKGLEEEFVLEDDVFFDVLLSRPISLILGLDFVRMLCSVIVP